MYGLIGQWLVSAAVTLSNPVFQDPATYNPFAMQTNSVRAATLSPDAFACIRSPLGFTSAAIAFPHESKTGDTNPDRRDVYTATDSAWGKIWASSFTVDLGKDQPPTLSEGKVLPAPRRSDLNNYLLTSPDNARGIGSQIALNALRICHVITSPLQEHTFRPVDRQQQVTTKPTKHKVTKSPAKAAPPCATAPKTKCRPQAAAPTPRA